VDDVLGYAGRRVVVLGASSPIGTATARLLADLGAEVHAAGEARPDVAGLASFTPVAAGDDDAALDALARIGSVMHTLFVLDAGLGGDVVTQAGGYMLPGSAVVTLGADLAPVGAVFRTNAVDARPDADPHSVAWVLVFLGSVRAAAISDAVIPASARVFGVGTSRVDSDLL
jgi:NAD(P)-dependent dehydrogenase (short-subunit alcohol dehydrogenase family)